MQVSQSQWSVQEKNIVGAALKAAREREVRALIEVVREKASNVSSVDDIWNLSDFLNARRHYIDGKYDDSESGIMFVLSELVKEEWITLSELAGLDSEKISKISALTRVL